MYAQFTGGLLPFYLLLGLKTQFWDLKAKLDSFLDIP